MVRKTLMALLFAGGMAAVPVALAEGTYGGSGDSTTGSGSATGSGSTMDGGMGSGMGGSSGTDSGSSGMSGSGAAAEAYRRECITDTQRRTQRCMDLQKSAEGASGSGPTSSGSGDTSSGMGSGSSTTSPTVP